MNNKIIRITKDTYIKHEFFNSLKCGTGRAYLLIKNNPEIDFSNYIIKVSLTNFAYDRQAEGSRGEYIYKLIKLSKNKNKIRKAILDGLMNESEDSWNLDQLFDLAKLFALDGDNEAKELIYDRYFHNIIDNDDWLGASEILELDGLDGLKFIAEKMGRELEIYSDESYDDDVIEEFQYQEPDIDAWEELELASKDNKYIKLYLDNIKLTEKEIEAYQKENPKIRIVKYSNIIEKVFNAKGFLELLRHEFTDEEIMILAKQLLIETNKSKQEKLLKIFRRYKFPFDSDFILNLVNEKSKKYMISEFAIEALQFFKTDKIRDFALNKLKFSKEPEVYVGLLISNYEKGDYKILLDLVNKNEDEDIIEDLACDYIKIYEKNKTKECQKPLEALYEKMNCGIHRNSLIQVLVESGVLSSKIKEEIQYDSDLDTRELYKDLDR